MQMKRTITQNSNGWFKTERQTKILTRNLNSSLFPHRQKKKDKKTTEKNKADGKKKIKTCAHATQSGCLFLFFSRQIRPWWNDGKTKFRYVKIASHHRQQRGKKPKRNNTIPVRDWQKGGGTSWRNSCLIRFKYNNREKLSLTRYPPLFIW